MAQYHCDCRYGKDHYEIRELTLALRCQRAGGTA